MYTTYISTLVPIFEDMEVRDVDMKLQPLKYQGDIHKVFTKIEKYNALYHLARAAAKKLIQNKLQGMTFAPIYTLDMLGTTNVDTIHISEHTGRTSKNWEYATYNLMQRVR